MFEVFSFISGDFFASGDDINLDENNYMDHMESHLSDSLWFGFPHGLEHSPNAISDSYNLDDLTVLNSDDLTPHAALNDGHLYFGDIIVGDPYNDMQFIHMQEGTNSCAVASQKEVLDSLGIDVPEIELSYMAYKNGWFDPSSGTMPDNMGKILEAFNVPVERGYDHSLTDINNALEHGEKVIVGLNANEIWNPQYDAAGNPVEQPIAGHAVWVTGLYQDDNGNWFVVMNDSGRPDGAGETVPAEDFMNAWNDFSNFAVITNTSGQIASLDSMGAGDLALVGASQVASVSVDSTDVPEFSIIYGVEGLSPTSDDIRNIEKLQALSGSKEPIGENTHPDIALGSSCSDCSGSCSGSCSGNCWSYSN